jgi:hypothetical protein
LASFKEDIYTIKSLHLAGSPSCPCHQFFLRRGIPDGRLRCITSYAMWTLTFRMMCGPPPALSSQCNDKWATSRSLTCSDGNTAATPTPAPSPLPPSPVRPLWNLLPISSVSAHLGALCHGCFFAFVSPLLTSLPCCSTHFYLRVLHCCLCSWRYSSLFSPVGHSFRVGPFDSFLPYF